MKRFLVVIFLFVYIGASTGITLTLHRCMGELVEVGMWQSEHCGTCGADKQTKPHKCCTTETQQIKLSVDQTVNSLPAINYAPAVIALLFDIGDLFDLSGAEQSVAGSGYPDRPPFEWSGVERLIQNCTLLI